MIENSFLDFDKEHIWHPYTSTENPLPTYEVVSAHESILMLKDGTELIDGMSSWWCAVHGYNHPVLNTAVTRQIKKMSHVMFGGITHQPAVDLVKKLLTITPEALQKVFLADSGSVSVEVAMKMAVQYWFAKGKKEKYKIAAFRGGYHGDTLGAMSVCDPVNGMHTMFSSVLPAQLFIDKPKTIFGQCADEDELERLTQFFSRHHQQMAAIILEPVVQGAGGMWFYSVDYLQHLRKLCFEYDVLLIADEIATGFGRTGKLFACEHADIVPDILCVGKALTGGYMTLAATLTTDKVAAGICESGHVLMHGPTFMGNPLACAVASASLDLLFSSGWEQQVANISSILKKELEVYHSHQSVKDVRVLGAIGVVETHDLVDVAKAQKIFVEAGVWIRPFGHLIYIMPPYIIKKEQLQRLCQAITLVL
ncbi:MAG: adenosylmethionine--8-amino-7-oxononanoate transaminase [Cellvibrionaceae bacterium]